MIPLRIPLPNDNISRMPPSPSDLNDWEKDVLTRWSKNPMP